MATSGLTFAAQVDDWVRQTEERLTAVFRESVEDVVSIMQTPVNEGGRMPIRDGFLRASITASTNGMPLANQVNPNPGKRYPYSSQVILLVIKGAQLGQTLYVGYAANYAPHMEYGTVHIAPRAFVRSAALQWPQIVARNVEKLKGSARSAHGAKKG